MAGICIDRAPGMGTGKEYINVIFQDWDQVESWVYRLLELPSEQRQAQLDALEAQQPVLAKDVAMLVEAHQHIDRFLEPLRGDSAFRRVIKQMILNGFDPDPKNSRDIEDRPSQAKES